MAKRMKMGFEIVDGYLLGEPVAKSDVVVALLAAAATLPAAAPFGRALEAVGVRVADEAFLALRLVLAGKTPSDAAVRRLRAFSGVARACAVGDRRGLAATLARDRTVLAERDVMDGEGRSLETLAAAARAGYYGELTG